MKISLILSGIVFTLLAVFMSHSADAAMSIDRYVKQTFIRGIPYEEAVQRYSAKDAPVLVAILNDTAEAEHWANAAVMLEIVGGEAYLKDIIEFIERDPGGEFTVEHYRAKTGAIMGLGYLIHQTHSSRAIRYLSESVQPNAWEKRDVAGLSALHITYEERNRDMSKYAVLGLALSGNDEAAEVLKRLQRDKFSDALMQQQVENLIDEALEANAEISQKGMVDYYRSYE